MDTGDVEIIEGSELYRFDHPEKYPDVEEERDQLLEEGIIYDDGENLIFKENYLLASKSTYGTALTKSANLILHGFKNGWNHWKDSDGNYLSDNENLKSKFNLN